jgi:hypothetical protein
MMTRSFFSSALQRFSTAKEGAVARLVLALAVAIVTGCSEGGGGSQPQQAQHPTLTDIAISPSNPTVNFADSVSFTARAINSDGSTQAISNSSDITWSSSEPAIVQINPAGDGSAAVTTKARGKAVIIAQYKSKLATTFITVVPVLTGVAIQPNPLDVPPEFALNATAIAQFNDGGTQDVTEQAVWRSGNPTLATVSDRAGSKGLLSAFKSGTAAITAQYAGFTGSIAANVVLTRLVGVSGLIFPPPNGLLLLPAVAMDGQDHAHAAWAYQGSGEVFYGGHDGTDWTPRIQVNAGQSPKDFAFGPTMRTNAAGARLIVWSGLNALYAVYAAPGQSFGAVQTIWPNPARPSSVTVADAVVTPSGDAFLIWGAPNTTFMARYDAVSGAWEPPVDLGPSPNVGLRAAFNANGDAIFAWQTLNVPINEYTLHAAVYPNDGSGFQAIKDLVVTHQPIWNIGAAINRNRDAVVVWAGPGTLPAVAQHSMAQGWHTNHALPLGASRGADVLRVAMNQANHIFVAWADQGQQRPYATRFTPAGGWETPEVLSTAVGLGSSTINAVAVADSGNAICLFVDAESFPPKEFKHRRYVVGQGWSPISVLNDPGLVGEPNAYLTVSYNHSGRGVIAWNEASAVSDGNHGLISTSFNFMELAPSIDP